MKKLLLVLLVLSMLLTSCYAADDKDKCKENTGSIDLSKKLASLNEGIEFSNNNVNITKGGDYTIFGNLTDGMIYINTDEKVKLRLDGVNITNSLGCAIFFDNCEKGFITIEDGSENFISYNSPSCETEADAAIFSNDDLEIKGSGKLTINGNYKHAIASDDDVSVQNGSIIITSIEHGIKANGKVEITGGNIDISSKGGKGLKADEEIVIEGGNININESEEGMESEGTILINDGTINITASDDGINTGNSNSKSDFRFGEGGMKNPDMMPPMFNENEMIPPHDEQIPNNDRGNRHEREQNMMIPEFNEDKMPQMPNRDFGGKKSEMMGGFGRVDEETALAHSITINGGTLNITANGDGIDSNGNLTIGGGNITINGPEKNGNGAIDYAGTFSITGGDVIALSSAGMIALPNADKTQNSISITFDNKYDIGSVVSVKDENGNEIISKTSDNTYQYMFLSSSHIKEGNKYNIYIDGTLIETVTATNGVLTSGKKANSGFGGGRNDKNMRPAKPSDDKKPNKINTEIKIDFKGTDIKFNQSPVIKNGTTLVPLRSIFEAFGMEVNWNDETKTVTAKKDNITITLQIGNKTANVNENEISLNTEPEIINNYTMVPVRFISESIGLNVEWNSALNKITIS